MFVTFCKEFGIQVLLLAWERELIVITSGMAMGKFWV